jgi:hypothetical protein
MTAKGAPHGGNGRSMADAPACRAPAPWSLGERPIAAHAIMGGTAACPPAAWPPSAGSVARWCGFREGLKGDLPGSPNQWRLAQAMPKHFAEVPHFFGAGFESGRLSSLRCWWVAPHVLPQRGPVSPAVGPVLPLRPGQTESRTLLHEGRGSKKSSSLCSRAQGANLRMA